MKNILRAALVSVALVGAGQALAAPKAAKEPNCDVNGKKSHVANEKACTKKHGTFTAATTTTTTTTTAPAAAPAAAAPAAAPADMAAPAADAPAK